MHVYSNKHHKFKTSNIQNKNKKSQKANQRPHHNSIQEKCIARYNSHNEQQKASLQPLQQQRNPHRTHSPQHMSYLLEQPYTEKQKTLMHNQYYNKIKLKTNQPFITKFQQQQGAEQMHKKTCMMIINKTRHEEARKWTQRRRKIESSHPKMRPSVGRDGEKVEGEAERKNLSFIYLIKAKPRRQTKFGP